MRSSTARALEGMLLLMLAVMVGSGCVKAPPAPPTPAGFLTELDCCAPPPPQDEKIVDLYFDPIGQRKDGPKAIADGQTVRVVVINVNPLLFTYDVSADALPREEGQPADFFKWWLGGLPEFSKIPAARTVSVVAAAVRDSMIVRTPKPCEQFSELAAQLQQLDDNLADYLNEVQDSTESRSMRLAEAHDVLTSASTRGAVWRSNIVLADSITGNAARDLTQAVTVLRDPVREFRYDANRLRAQYRQLPDTTKCAQDVREYVGNLDRRAAQYEARLEDLRKEVPAMQALYARYHGLATDPTTQYRVSTLDYARKPSDVTVTVSRRTLEKDAQYRQVDRHTYNVGGDGLFHINGGFLVAAPIQSSDYGAAERTVFDPATGGTGVKHVSVAKREQDWRVVPQVYLSTNLGHVGGWSRTFFTAGVGLDAAGTARVGYFLGGGRWLSDGLGVQFGAYIGERQRLGRGQALGDIVGKDGVTVDKTLGTTIGAGVFYRIK